MRKFLALAPLIVVGLLRTDIACATSPFSYDTVKVGDNVYAFVEPEVRGIVSGNIVAVIGEQGVLIFDSGHHPTITRSIIADLKKLTPKPVRYLVNSNWHDDHWVGNAEIAAAYPNVSIIAHTFTAQMIASRKDKFRGTPCKAELIEQALPIRKQINTGKLEDGTTLNPRAKEFRMHMLAQLETQIFECDKMLYRGPDITFDNAINIDLGNRIVKVMHLGRGNTAGDAIAYLPDGKILLTGDVLVHPFPYATESYIREWAKVLQNLEGFDTAAIVPGHGKVLRDKQYLQDVATLLQAISSQVHAVYRKGMSAGEVRKKINVAALREKMVGDDPFIGANFDYMIMQSAVDRAVQEEQGKLKPEGG